jgi:hypothetical protein
MQDSHTSVNDQSVGMQDRHTSVKDQSVGMRDRHTSVKDQSVGMREQGRDLTDRVCMQQQRLTCSPVGGYWREETTRGHSVLGLLLNTRPQFQEESLP